MSGEKEDDYLCEGLSEEIINALTRIPGLRVIARTSAFAVARAGIDVREIGTRLEVDNVLEGACAVPVVECASRHSWSPPETGPICGASATIENWSTC